MREAVIVSTARTRELRAAVEGLDRAPDVGPVATLAAK